MTKSMFYSAPMEFILRTMSHITILDQVLNKTIGRSNKNKIKYKTKNSNIFDTAEVDVHYSKLYYWEIMNYKADLFNLRQIKSKFIFNLFLFKFPVIEKHPKKRYIIQDISYRDYLRKEYLSTLLKAAKNNHNYMAIHSQRFIDINNIKKDIKKPFVEIKLRTTEEGVILNQDIPEILKIYKDGEIHQTININEMNQGGMKLCQLKELMQLRSDQDQI